MIGAGVGKIAGAIGGASMEALAKENEELSELMIKELVKPITASFEETLDNNTKTINDNLGKEPTYDEKIKMPAFLKPQLNWD